MNDDTRRAFLRSLALPVLGPLGMPARAQEVFPGRPITLVVPFPPGGVADVVGRPVAEAMGRHFQQPVVIENKGGAGGGIGMAQVARSRPDGHTLLMALSSVVVLPEADRVMRRAPMFELDQLAPIARFTADPTVLVVRADSPWKTYGEFADHVKTVPGRLTFGSSGNYGTMHVPMEQWKAATGSYLLHVPYTGAGPAVVALLAGQVDALSTGPSSILQQVKAGRLRALAHWGEGPLAVLPDVPSLRELGVPIGYSQWAGLFAPAGTPSAVLARIGEAARFAARDPRAMQSLVAAGSVLRFQDAPEFARFVQADAQAMARVVQRIGPIE